MGEKSARVVVILPYMNEYRLPVMERLHGELKAIGVRMEVQVGQPVGQDVDRRDAVQTGFVVQLKQGRIPVGSRSVVFKIPRWSAISADLLILEQAVKNIETFALLLIRRLMGKRTAFWGHGATITLPANRKRDFLQAWMVRRADWYFAYTKGSANRAIERGIPSARVTVLNNSVIAATSQVRSHVSPDTVWRALYIGGLDESKRIRFLVDAARKIFRKDPRFRLTIAGDGALADWLVGLGEPWLNYVGRIGSADKGPLAESSQILMVPGRVGLIAIDSFQLSLPIITTDWPFHAPEFEYLNDANSIVASEAHPDDIDSYAESVLSLMRDSERLKALQLAASEEAPRYSGEAMVRAFADGIRGALEGSR